MDKLWYRAKVKYCIEGVVIVFGDIGFVEGVIPENILNVEMVMVIN